MPIPTHSYSSEVIQPILLNTQRRCDAANRLDLPGGYARKWAHAFERNVKLALRRIRSESAQRFGVKFDI
jgi:hypothetical protein